MSHPVLQTERLTLKPLSSIDAETLFSMFGDDETMRYWSGFRADTLEGTRELIEGLVRDSNCHYWTLWRPGDSGSIGYVGFIGNPGVPGFGYALCRDFWGQGLVVEACRAALEWGFGSKGLDRVELWIHEDNARSIGVARKLGFRAVGQFYRGRDAPGSEPYYYRCFGMLAGDWSADLTAPRRTLFDAVEPILAVPDVAAAANYYCERLGFELAFLYGEPPSHGAVSRGLWTPNRASLQLTAAERGAEIRPSAAVCFHTGAGIDALYEEYVNNGVEIVQPLQTMPWGVREFRLVDLNGYPLRFVANP
ncbi:MAG: GNAT family N-acetyltransferase [Gammaproteobacteria bacterium]|jgi:RimJ/RimL family protein N-acetyltransferase/uncharacterized glyoxalase superfamily protein PhnB